MFDVLVVNNLGDKGYINLKWCYGGDKAKIFGAL